MKQQYLHITILLFSLLFVSCSKEEEISNVSSLTVTAEVKTRSTVSDKDYFALNDCIGMFIYDDQGNMYNSSCSNAEVKFIEGYTWEPQTLIELTSKVGKLYAYYPYSSSVTSNIIPIETNSQMDYLYSTGAEVSFDKYKPDIVFEHALCQIVFKFTKSDASSSSIMIQGVTLSNDGSNIIANNGTVDLKIGMISSTPQSTSSVSFAIGDDEAHALLLPCDMTNISGHVKVSFTINNHVYERYISNEVWEHGNRYTYNVVYDSPANSQDISDNAILLYLDSKSTISPWETGETATSFTADIDAKEPEPAVAVDLGLPSGTKWANRNIGAYNYYDYGKLFAWGECATKSTYDRSTYQYDKQFIGKDIASTIFDVSHKVWSNDWRMPSRTEILELMNECQWVIKEKEGVEGMLVTGPNGNSIFLPDKSATYFAKGTKVGNYWSASYDPENIDYAYQLEFYLEDYYTLYKKEFIQSNPCSRYEGRAIRPVCK